MQDERIAHSETIMRTPTNKAKGEEERKLSIPASPRNRHKTTDFVKIIPT